MKISVIGTGYVGLVSGACFAERGNNVVCLDVDKEKIRLLEGGTVPIFEPGLDSLIARNVAAGRLRFTSDVEEAVSFGMFQVIAVGTPADEDGSADLKHVLAAARQIGRYMNDYKVVITKSTVPVGTGEKVRNGIAEELALRSTKIDFSIVSNPEFLKEGAAINDFMRPDRIVIGTEDERALRLMRSLYAPFSRNHDKVICMDVRSAELTKYAANGMLATRISFMNELALLSEELGADIEQVRLGIGADPRIGRDFLYSGCGYGGSCFPKDVKALIRTAEDNGAALRVLAAVDAANDAQKLVLVKKVTRLFGEDLTGRHFAIWGLAFKPNTDDMREAPSRDVISGLLARGATVSAYDPAAMIEARRVFGDDARIDFARTPEDALADADALIIVTEWKEFQSPDFAALRTMLKEPIVFDGRNLYEMEELSAYGLRYFPVGRGKSEFGAT